MNNDMNQDLELCERDLRAFFAENKDHRVGLPGDDELCLIAEYFYQKKQLDVSVRGIEITDQENPACYRSMQLWEAIFVGLIDSRYEHCGEVNGAEAIEALDDALIDAREAQQMTLWEEPLL